MRKVFIVFAVMLAVVACGNKSAASGKDGQEKNNEPPVEMQEYANEKFGFTVEVPASMKRSAATLMADNGAIFFTPDTKEGEWVLNRVDITGHRHIFDEPYTTEKIKQEYEEETANKEGLVSKECKDAEYSYTIKGETLTEIHRHIYSGAVTADVVVCFDAEHEAELGGEIAEYILSSLKFGK